MRIIVFFGESAEGELAENKGSGLRTKIKTKEKES